MIDALRILLGHLGEALSLRGELATLELHRARRRLVGLVLLLVGLWTGALLTLFFGSLWVVIYFWETHRLAAIAGLAGGYLLLALLAAWRLHYLLTRSPLVFSETLGVLRKDMTCLFGKNTDSNPPNETS